MIFFCILFFFYILACSFNNVGNFLVKYVTTSFFFFTCIPSFLNLNRLVRKYQRFLLYIYSFECIYFIAIRFYTSINLYQIKIFRLPMIYLYFYKYQKGVEHIYFKQIFIFKLQISYSGCVATIL